MNNDEMLRFLDTELERAKAKEKQAEEALQQAREDVQRIERARAAYSATPKEVEPAEVRPHRIIPIIFAGGKRLDREQFRKALKAAGWSVTYEERELNKLINANKKSGYLAQDGPLFRHPDDAERERTLRKKKR